MSIIPKPLGFQPVSTDPMLLDTKSSLYATKISLNIQNSTKYLIESEANPFITLTKTDFNENNPH